MNTHELSQAQTSMHFPRVVDTSTAAKLVGLSYPTLLRLVKAGQGPRVVRLSERRVGISLADLQRWIDQLPDSQLEPHVGEAS